MYFWNLFVTFAFVCGKGMTCKDKNTWEQYNNKISTNLYVHINWQTKNYHKLSSSLIFFVLMKMIGTFVRTWWFLYTCTKYTLLFVTCKVLLFEQRIISSCLTLHQCHITRVYPYFKQSTNTTHYHKQNSKIHHGLIS